MERMIVRYTDGRVVKGQSNDFSPLRDQFHIRSLGKRDNAPVALTELKAIYYVKYWDGRPFHKEKKTFPALGTRPGRRVVVRFADGEELFGITQSYSPQQKGFYVYPTDPDSNNERIFVINGPSVAEVSFPE
ncbi:MAG: hypothetical protein AMXMBFR64_51010 [Myxococcales bacterium]